MNFVWTTKIQLDGTGNRATCVFNILHKLQGLGPSLNPNWYPDAIVIIRKKN